MKRRNLLGTDGQGQFSNVLLASLRLWISEEVEDVGDPHWIMARG